MIRRLFTDIAAIYDRMNHVLSLGLDRRWRRLAAAELENSPSMILDLACGTGDFAFELARRFPGAGILGVDLTPAMLDIARSKNRSAQIVFVEGDAMDLSSVPDAASTGSFGVAGGRGMFDLCSCAFGFRNFPDRRKALEEVGRVLKPGGELLVLEFFRPRNTLLGLFTSIWVRMLSAMFAGRRTSAYRYLRESMNGMATVEEFVSMAEAEGFRLQSRRFFMPCCTCLHLHRLRNLRIATTQLAEIVI